VSGTRALFHLGHDDVSAIRFGISPSHELALAVRVLLSPGSQPLHWGWLRSLRGRVPTRAFELVASVVGDQGYFPDFLTCTPEWDTTFATELELIRATSHETFRRDMAGAHARPPLRGASGREGRAHLERLVADPAKGIAELADAWAELHDALLAPSWDQLERILRADVGLRVRRIGEVGLAAMVGGLHSTVSWQEQAVRVETTSYGDDVDCAGNGLVLVPSVMNPLRCTILTHTPGSAAIFYPAMGVAERWQLERDTDALEGVLGSGRAKVLLSLDGPVSTSEIGEVCGLAVSTASFHLSRLRDAGLVDSRREGPRVLHVRTPLGEALVTGAT
jgi:Helix-turn-helix domain/Family of unknown function (DUF5937)